MLLTLILPTNQTERNTARDTNFLTMTTLGICAICDLPTASPGDGDLDLNVNYLFAIRCARPVTHTYMDF